MSYYVEEPAPILAPGVYDVYEEETGDFVTRWYDGQEYDINGDPKE